MQTEDRCSGCQCMTCRWQHTGHHCHYNEHGAFTSRCNWCQDARLKGMELKIFKSDVNMCKGYEKRYVR